MEECEVELVESVEFSKLGEFKVRKIPVQSIVVNGQEQVIEEEAIVLVCPTCGEIIKQFQPGVEYIDILKSCNTDDEKLLNSYVYCRHCGQKISLMRPMPVEGCCEEVTK